MNHRDHNAHADLVAQRDSRELEAKVERAWFAGWSSGYGAAQLDELRAGGIGFFIGGIAVAVLLWAGGAVR